MGIKLFMKLKKCETNYGLYPLCITTKEQNFEYNSNCEIFFEPDISIVQEGAKSKLKLH